MRPAIGHFRRRYLQAGDCIHARIRRRSRCGVMQIHPQFSRLDKAGAPAPAPSQTSGYIPEHVREYLRNPGYGKGFITFQSGKPRIQPREIW